MRTNAFGQNVRNTNRFEYRTDTATGNQSGSG
jgi:hypothetical protein